MLDLGVSPVLCVLLLLLLLPPPPAATKDYDLLTASNPERWVICCYFALTTMVTIGMCVCQARRGAANGWGYWYCPLPDVQLPYGVLIAPLLLLLLATGAAPRRLRRHHRCDGG